MVPAVCLRQRGIQELLCPCPFYRLSYLNNFIYFSHCGRLINSRCLCGFLSLVNKNFIRSVSRMRALNLPILINILSWLCFFVSDYHCFIIFIPEHVCSCSLLLIFGWGWCLRWMILLVINDWGWSLKTSSTNVYRRLFKVRWWTMMLR